MADDDDRITAALRAYAEGTRAAQASHVAPGDLLAYHDGLLSDAEEEAIRAHLALCRRCAGLILEAATFPAERQDPAHRLSDAELHQRWRSFRMKLGEASGVAATPAPPPPVARRGLASLLRALRGGPSLRVRLQPLFGPLPALATALVVIGLGLAIWTVSLSGRLAHPAVGVYVADLLPREMVERREGETTTVTVVPAWADRILLLLNVFAPRVSYRTYEVAIFGAAQGDRRIWSSRELRLREGGGFALEVPRRFLSTGTYRIEVVGLDGERREPLAVYDLLLDVQ